jgi:oxygen-dependent protoporphyrinogen oxidase
VLGIDATPTLARIFRWERGMPQYNLGHLDLLREIDQRLEALPGIQLCGSAYRGVGIPDCIQSGDAAAERTLANLPDS